MLSREEIAARIQTLPLQQQAVAIELALKLYGARADVGIDERVFKQFAPFRFDSAAYICKYLGWTPWSGTEEQPGQCEVLAAYDLALRQQHERRDFENGLLDESQLTVWQPGQVIRNRIRVPAGHTVGKTKLSNGVVNHFFDCFPPAIIYTFAPTAAQIKYLLWKEIGADRTSAQERGHKLPGRVLETCEIKYKPNHFALGRATNDNGGRGTERVQGQHGPYLLFVLDEAEGVSSFVYSAVESMASGGIVIVLMLANPRTQESDFDAQKDRVDTVTLRISCAWHPNVLQGREVVPGAVRREYVEKMIAGHAEAVAQHDADHDTFELPFPVRLKDGTLPSGTIFKPDPEFLFRVLGKAPAGRTGNTFVPRGRYESACKRAPTQCIVHHDRIRIGVDVARFGDDFGTVYTWHAGAIWRTAQLWKEETGEYLREIKSEAIRLSNQAVLAGRARPLSLHIRIDGSGGFGAGVVDALRADEELKSLFPDFGVFEVHFGGVAQDESQYANIVTQMYAEAAETLRGVRVENAPNALEADLCKRTFDFINHKGESVKAIADKAKFRKDYARSPDDGDGFILCASPDHVFAHLKQEEAPQGRALNAIRMNAGAKPNRHARRLNR